MNHQQRRARLTHQVRCGGPRLPPSDVGDRVRIKVTNNLPLGTDIHWHGIHLPNEMDGVAPYTQDPIAPNGGTFTYEFTADTRNNGMYHAHMHGEEAVPNGMLGVFQVGAGERELESVFL